MNPTNDGKKPRARARPPTVDTSPEYPVGHVADYTVPPAADTSGEYPVEHVAGYPTAPVADTYPEYPAGHVADYLAAPSPEYPVGYAADYPAAPAPEYPARTANVYETPTLRVEHDRSLLEPTAHAHLDMGVGAEQTLELWEEQLVARKDLREVGQVRVRTVVEEVPGRLEVEALREEVEIEHVPMGQVVSERQGPWEEDGMVVLPVYEEQLVVVKRLVLKEHLRIRRVSSTERQLFEDTLRRDRLVVEDPSNTHMVHERYPDADGDDVADARLKGDQKAHEEGGLLGQLMRKALG